MAYRPDPHRKFIKAVGANIRYYRLKRGFTLEALGEDIGLDKSNMHRIEMGKNITLSTLSRFAVFLEVDVWKLLETDASIVLEDAERYIIQKKESRRKNPKRKKASKKK